MSWERSWDKGKVPYLVLCLFWLHLVVITRQLCRFLQPPLHTCGLEPQLCRPGVMHFSLNISGATSYYGCFQEASSFPMTSPAHILLLSEFGVGGTLSLPSSATCCFSLYKHHIFFFFLGLEIVNWIKRMLTRAFYSLPFIFPYLNEQQSHFFFNGD